MAFDGTRALVVGDYVTAASGAYAGQLGPWAGVVELVGLAPRSVPVKVGFVAYGLALLFLTIAFARGKTWAWRWLLVAACLGLWYFPFGTLFNGVAIGLLLTTLRPRA